ncbi:MAG: lysophospholipid acyltransferase family protein [Burkholderiales bacterium]
MLSAAWRSAVAGVCFALFGIGGIGFSLVVFPLLRLLPGGRSAHERRARVLVRHSFLALLAALQALRILRIEARNLASLRPSGALLVLANHPSYLDIVVLIAHIPDAVCVVKSKLWSNPFFGGVVRAAGYIRNDDPQALVPDCAACLAQGLPLIIFPEGTRTRPGTPLHFARGAAHIALATGVPILPVILGCEPRVLARGAKWYQMPARAFCITLEALPCTSAAALLPTKGAGARSLTSILERYFIDHLQGHERLAA